MIRQKHKVEAVCDGCGKAVELTYDAPNHKIGPVPTEWYEGVVVASRHACSKECAAKLMREDVERQIKEL